MKLQAPVRPEGQQSVIALRTEPLETVRFGIIGLGSRGASAARILSHVPNCRITALCDISQEAVDKCLQILDNISEVRQFSGLEDAWKQLCQCPDVDIVYICTDWNSHVPVALHAMESGKHVALEVPAASTLDEIWSLVDMAEKTRRHCIMMENCVYDSFEMSTLAMVKAGVFGEIIHAEGAYHHCLDKQWAKWRLEYNKASRGDLYPTHGIGPVCLALDIHRGDRMKTLVSMDTASFNGVKVYERNVGECDSFQNADQTDTLIKTEKGKTILLQHNVMTPRPYDRIFKVVGTEGYAGKYPIEQIYLRSEDVQDPKEVGILYQGDEMKRLQAEYPVDILTDELVNLEKPEAPRGDMDFIMFYRLVHCLHNGLPLDMDVYDMAEWCSISELSRLSLENGNVPVEVPDFTRGSWKSKNI
jgi:predicted dehydrogenase